LSDRGQKTGILLLDSLLDKFLIGELSDLIDGANINISSYEYP
jgi:hypothetical protein